MPLPSDPKVIFLGGLFALALLAALYVAAEIVLPLVLAVVLKFLLQPVMRLMEQWHVPRILAAFMLILAVFHVEPPPLRCLCGSELRLKLIEPADRT